MSILSALFCSSGEIPNIIPCCAIDLSVSEVTGRRVCYNIRHLPLNKDNSFANALEWTADVKVPRVVLQSNMSLTSISSTVKVCSS